MSEVGLEMQRTARNIDQEGFIPSISVTDLAQMVDFASSINWGEAVWQQFGFVGTRRRQNLSR